MWAGVGTGGGEAVVAKHSGRPEGGAAGEITRNQGEGGRKQGQQNQGQKHYSAHTILTPQ